MIKKAILVVVISAVSVNLSFAQQSDSGNNQAIQHWMAESLQDEQVKHRVMSNLENLSFLSQFGLGDDSKQNAIAGAFRNGALQLRELMSAEQLQQMANLQQNLAARLLTNSMAKDFALNDQQRTNLFGLNLWAAQQATQMGVLAVDHNKLAHALINNLGQYESRLKSILNENQWEKYQSKKVDIGAKMVTEFMKFKFGLDKEQTQKIQELNLTFGHDLIELGQKRSGNRYYLGLNRLDKRYDRQMKKILDKNQYKNFQVEKEKLKKRLMEKN